MEHKEKTNKKKVCFNCDNQPMKKLKTVIIKDSIFSKKNGEIRRPKRSLSTKLPLNFVPRLHPKKSKIKAPPLKLNKAKSSYLYENRNYIIDKQLSDEEEVSCDDVSSDSSSSSLEDKKVLLLQEKINEIKIKSNLFNEKPKNENNNQDELELNKKTSSKSYKFYDKNINNPIQEKENEDKDFSDEDNLKINDINKNDSTPLNEKSETRDKNLYPLLRFSSDASDFKLDEEIKNSENNKNPKIEPFNEEDQQIYRTDSIKALRKRMARIRTKTTEEKLKETVEIVHRKMIENFDMELTNDNGNNDNNDNKKKMNYISNSLNLQADEIPKRKKSMSILEMLSFSQKGKK